MKKWVSPVVAVGGVLLGESLFVAGYRIVSLFGLRAWFIEEYPTRYRLFNAHAWLKSHYDCICSVRSVLIRGYHGRPGVSWVHETGTGACVAVRSTDGMRE